MGGPKDTDKSRTQTDDSLRAERDRSDDELLARSTALAEDADKVVRRARERARLVLELARERENQQLLGASEAATAAVREERRVADAALNGERRTEDAQRLDERELRRAAMIQLLAHERDITDRTLAAERRVADRSVGAREDLLAIVAHDLRNMLNALVINASLVVMARDLGFAARAGADIQRVGGLMAQLLEDLLDFSRFAAGKLTLAAGDVDLLLLVADAVTIHEPVAKLHDLSIAVRTDLDSLIIQGDGRRLTRLLMNLLGNAVKFTPEGGRIEIAVEVVGDECELVVSDTGIGIPQDQLESIFERFEQLTMQPQRTLSGVGLGLYIARLITEAHRGRIWAESLPDRGAAFHVRLPIK